MKRIYLFILLLFIGCSTDTDTTIDFVISNKTGNRINLKVYYKYSYYGNPSNVYYLGANKDTLIYWTEIDERDEAENYYYEKMPFDSILIFKSDSLKATFDFSSRKEWDYIHKDENWEEYRLYIEDGDFQNLIK